MTRVQLLVRQAGQHLSALWNAPILFATLAMRIRNLEELMPRPIVINTIPVPNGWSAEQAWECISRDGHLPPYDGEPGWANIVTDPETGHLVQVLPIAEEDE